MYERLKNNYKNTLHVGLHKGKRVNTLNFVCREIKIKALMLEYKAKHISQKYTHLPSTRDQF